MTLTLPSDYAYCLASSFLMILQYGLMGPWTMSIRIPIFNKDYMKANFESEHKNSSVRTPMWGYPDFGSGVYSKKLPYDKWLKFNSALRVHINTMEYISIAVISVLILGVFNPCLAAGIGIAWILARFFYAWTYMKNIKAIESAAMLSFALIFASSAAALFKIYSHLSSN